MPIKRDTIAEWNNITNKPSQFPPAPHAADHASDGADAITPADIGAAPAQHASQHASDGADAIRPADIGAADRNHTHTPNDVGAAPIQHASQHASSGSDPISPTDIHALPTNPDYDTGWVSAALGTTYIFTHNLGVVPRLCIILVRYSAYPDHIQINHPEHAYNRGVLTFSGADITPTTIKVGTGNNSSFYLWDHVINGIQYPNDQFRILLWK